MTSSDSTIIAPTDVIVPPQIGSGDVFSMLLSVAFIVAAILLLGWLYSRSKLGTSGDSSAIEIVAARSLGPKDRLIVVDVGKTQLLVGLSSSGMQTLHTFESPIVTSTSTRPASGFAERLNKTLKRYGR